MDRGMLWGQRRGDGKAERERRGRRREGGGMDLAGPRWEPPRPRASFTSLNHVRSHQRRCQLLSRPPHSWKNTQSCTHANTNTRTQKSYIDFCAQTQTTPKNAFVRCFPWTITYLTPYPASPVVQFPSNRLENTQTHTTHTDTHSIPVLNMVMRK